MEQSSRQKTTTALKRLFGEVDKMEDTSIRNFSQLHETMNNLAVVSGGVAVGALVLLSSNIHFFEPLILIGIVSLFIELPFYFIFKIRAHLKTGDVLKEIVNKIKNPIQELIDLSEDKEVADGSFHEQVKGRVDEINSWMIENEPKIKLNSNNNNNIHWPEAICYILFAFGLIMIGLGLLQPYFHTLISLFHPWN